MSDPFLITGPAVVSFSGGRTSGYMLWRILQAHGGVLPDDVLVCFQNTGREMPATLDFVRDCGAAWNVAINWLEYARDPANGYASTVQVNHNSASRAGEPFEAMLAGKKMLPNPVMRFCTTELKVRCLKRWLMSQHGWTHWTSAIGIRADEPLRVAKQRKPKPERWTIAMPLADAGIAKADVLAFWAAQPFDLTLAGSWEGNCDGCFLKSRASISRMLVDHPERMAWWSRAETLFTTGPHTSGKFRADREDYASMAGIVRDQGAFGFARVASLNANEAAEGCDDVECSL